MDSFAPNSANLFARFTNQFYVNCHASSRRFYKFYEFYDLYNRIGPLLPCDEISDVLVESSVKSRSIFFSIGIPEFAIRRIFTGPSTPLSRPPFNHESFHGIRLLAIILRQSAVAPPAYVCFHRRVVKGSMHFHAIFSPRYLPPRYYC